MTETKRVTPLKSDGFLISLKIKGDSATRYILVGPKSPQHMFLGQHNDFVITPTKMVKLPDLQTLKDVLECSKQSQLNSGNYEYYYRAEGKVMFSQLSVCPQSASWILVHCSTLLQCGRYAFYWNAFL